MQEEITEKRGLIEVGGDSYFNYGSDEINLVESGNDLKGDGNIVQNTNVNINENFINDIGENIDQTYVADDIYQPEDAPVDNSQTADEKIQNENSVLLGRASPVSHILVSGWSDSDSESAKKEKGFDEKKAILEDGYDTELSDDSALESDNSNSDKEVTFRPKCNTATSSENVKKDNYSSEFGFILTCMQGLGEKIQQVHEQNSESEKNRRDMERTMFEQVEKTETNMRENNTNIRNIQGTLLRNNDNVKEAIGQVQVEINKNLSEAVEKAEYSLKNEINISNASLRTEFLNNQSELRCDIIISHENIAKSQEAMAIKQDAIINKQDVLENNMIEGQKIFRDEMDELQSCVRSQKVFMENISTDVLSAVSGVEAQVEEVAQKMNMYKNELELLQGSVGEMKGILDTYLKDKDEMSAKMEMLQDDLNQIRLEMLAMNADRDMEVVALRAGIPEMAQNASKEVEQKVVQLAKTMSEVQEGLSQSEARLLELGGLVAANTAQGNALNDHMHRLNDKVVEIGNVTPEMLQSTVFQALSQFHGKIDTTDYPDTNPPRVYPPPVPFADLPMSTAQMPENTAIPSISSSPLLPESYGTPSPSQALNFPTEVAALVPKFRSGRSDHIIADMVKRDQKPCFSGDNVSPPIFLREVETFFQLVQIEDDRDRLQIFPNFLHGTPAEWWKIVSSKATSWDMARRLLLDQYFNDYEKQRYKQEWINLDIKKFANVEEFVIRGLQILNTIKTKESDQKRCERITVKLPEPLRDYLLHSKFTSTQDFLNQIKMAMLLKNFDTNLYFNNQNSNNNNNSHSNNRNLNNGRNNGHNSGQSYNNGNQNGSNNANVNNPNPNNGNSQNNGLNNGNSNNGSANNGNNSYIGMNPNYRGDPRNYDPNYKYNQANRGSYGGSANNSSYNNQRSPPRSSNSRGNGNGSRNNGYNRGRGSFRSNGNGGNRGGPDGNVSGGTQTSRAPGVNQVGWAMQQPSPAPLAIMPTQSPGISTPTSPSINHFHFNFTPQMLKGVAKSLFNTPPPTTPAPPQDREEAEEDMETENS